MNYIEPSIYNIKIKNEDWFKELCEEQNKKLTSDNIIIKYFKVYCEDKNIKLTYEEKDNFTDEVKDNFITMQFTFRIPFIEIEKKKEQDFDSIYESIIKEMCKFTKQENIKEIYMNFKPQIYVIVPNLTYSSMDVGFVWQFTYKK